MIFQNSAVGTEIISLNDIIVNDVSHKLKATNSNNHAVFGNDIRNSARCALSKDERYADTYK